MRSASGDSGPGENTAVETRHQPTQERQRGLDFTPASLLADGSHGSWRERLENVRNVPKGNFLVKSRGSRKNEVF